MDFWMSEREPVYFAATSEVFWKVCEPCVDSDQAS